MNNTTYERCGIITACLTDPLSQFISKIMGLKDGEHNSVGFYYQAELHGISKCTVILFNIYDNDPVPWLRLGYTMDLLLASPFVTKITFYPVVTNQHGSLLSRATLSTVKHSREPKLEDMFRTVVVETINSNASAIHDKNVSYTALLLKIFGVTGGDADRLMDGLITGYSLVNRVLLTLMGIKQSDLNKIGSSIVPCPLLKKPVTISAPRETVTENDIKYIVEESRREITKLVAVFVDLYTTHETFRNNVLTTRTSSVYSDHFNLMDLFSKETELVTHIISGIRNGMISNGTLNDIIYDLSNERFSLVNQIPGHTHQPLPMSTNPSKTVQIIMDTPMCTFQDQSSNYNHHNDYNSESLRDLGVYLEHIIDSFDNPDPLTINLGGIVAAYNNAIKGIPSLESSKINIPTNLEYSNLSTQSHSRNIGFSSTLSRQAIVTMLKTFPSSKHIQTSNKLQTTISVPMYNGNLSTLTDQQLIDILVYIDSLRDSDGSGDTRFANLQNEITHELSLRRHR
jgi:hypothetical protein